MTGHIFQINAEFVLHDDLYVIFVRVVGLRQLLIFVAVQNRSHVRYAGTDIQHVHLLGRIHFDIFANLGARTDKAHIARKHIYQLGQLIEFVLADEITRPRNPGIVPSNGNEPLLIRPDTHRTELEQLEVAIVPAYAYLTIKYRSARIQFNPHRQYNEQRT